MDLIFLHQIDTLFSYQIATRRVLNQLAETDPKVAKAMDKYEEFYQEAMDQFMLNIENKFGSAFAAHYDLHRKIY